MNDDYISELLAASPEEQAQWVEAMAMHTAPPGDFMAGYTPTQPQPAVPTGGGFNGFLQSPTPPGIQQSGAAAPEVAYTAPAGKGQRIPPVQQLF